MEQEELEQRELGPRQVDDAVAALDLVRHRIELEVPEAQHLPARAESRPAQQRPQAREQLVEGEGLHDVVVRARVKAGHAVRHGVPGGQHQDRRAVAARAHRAAYLQPVHVRHHHVEDHGVGAVLLQRCQGLLAIGRDRGLVALEPQRPLQ